jgi:hypothetical protein
MPIPKWLGKFSQYIDQYSRPLYCTQFGDIIICGTITQLQEGPREYPQASPIGISGLVLWSHKSLFHQTEWTKVGACTGLYIGEIFPNIWELTLLCRGERQSDNLFLTPVPMVESVTQ